MARIVLTQDEIVFNEGKSNEYRTKVEISVTEREGARSVRGGILLSDLDKRQQLREHTVYLPGQECYLRLIDTELLADTLAALGSSKTPAEIVTGTVGTNDISLATIKGLDNANIDSDEKAQQIQDILSVRLVETGNFLLSFDSGVISRLLTTTDGAGNSVVKVFTDAGDAEFKL